MSGISRRCQDICSRTAVTLLAVQAESLAKQDEEQLNAAFSAFLTATMDLKSSLLAGFLLNEQKATRDLDDAIRRIGESVEFLTLVLNSLKLSARLFSRASDKKNLLIRREKVFKSLDYDALYERLEANFAVLPKGVYWDEVAQAVKSGGINAGLRILAKSVNQLRNTFRRYRSKLVKLKYQPLELRTKILHRQTIFGAATHILWIKLMAQSVYLTLCIQEGSVATFERDQSAARYGRRRKTK